MNAIASRVVYSRHGMHSERLVTTHYSAAELNELIHAAEPIVTRGKTETPNLMLIGMKAEETIGNLSEKEKGLAKISR